MKRFGALFFLMLFVIVIIWLFIEGLKPETLPIGSRIPKINYTDINGTKQLEQDNKIYTLIVYFSEKCEHCQFELNELSNNIDKMEKVKVYLFTSNKEYLQSENIKQYSELLHATNVTFGIINYDEYNVLFGGSTIPALYFFNAKGVLYTKKTGRTRYEYINKEINKHFLK